MPVRPLPSNPSLDHLKYQAKDLIRDHAAHKPDAAQRLREFHPRWRNASDGEIFSATLRLNDAQLSIAREYGFPSWARLKRHCEKPTQADQFGLPHHERIEDRKFRHAVDLLDAGDEARLRAHLRGNPKLSRQRVVFEGGNYFRNPTLLEFVAENPVRHGRLPANIVQIARIIVEAGVDQSALDETLGLVSTGRVTRECGVQIPLIQLLCGCGADPDLAATAAVAHGEMQALEELLRRGAKMTLPLAAALGRIEVVRRLLPAADSHQRHLALALASQHNRVEVVRSLLDAGEDPNRYNPVGSHSHSTPLHQAAAAGHEELARLLLERGAKIDIEDVLWHGTPADWAEHEGKAKLAAYLREPRKATQNF